MTNLYLTVIVFSICGSLIGNYLHHQEGLLVADGMSHSLLLGIILFSIVRPDFDSLYLFPFLVVFSIGVTLAYDWLITSKRFQKDTSLLFITLSLYALAILIISRYAQNSHIDFDRIFLGQILFISFNQVEIGGFQIPTALLAGSILLGLTLLIYLLYYKKIVHFLFDKSHYTRHNRHHWDLKYLFLLLFNCFFIMSFEHLGIPLTLTLLSAPALFGQLFSKHLYQALVLSALFASLTASTGLYAALELNLNVSGAICFICLSSLLAFVLLKRLTINQKNKNST